MLVLKKIQNELLEYFDKEVPLSDNIYYSQHKLVKRIVLFDNRSYGSGKKLDKQARYKFWNDIITPRIDTEVKNIDFDTKDIKVYSERKKDAFVELITNSAIREWMRNRGEAERLNEIVEESSGWGNIVLKKLKNDYEKVDLKNFFVINQTARTLNDTPVIERHNLTASDVKAQEGLWDVDIDKLLEDCKNNFFSPTPDNIGTPTEVPYYETYERNGEISMAEFKEAKGQKPSTGDENKYVLARVIVVGVNRAGAGQVVFCEKIKEMPYKEYHRGRYKGRWMREGLIELLMDVQVRANEIGNQISRGLELASKTIFSSSDRVIANNILTGMRNGDIIRSADFKHVEIRMNGMDQLIADWNRLMSIADGIANSREVVQGEALPSGTPFRLGALYNQNANKLFDFIREKLGGLIQSVFEEWVLKDIIRDLKGKDVIRYTGDSEAYKRLYAMVVESWYINNLVAIGPHDGEMAEAIKASKMRELMSNERILIKLTKEMFDDFEPHAEVIITGEQVSMMAKKESLATFIGLEMDPVRRQAEIEMAMRLDGFDVASLPKSPPQALMPQQGGAPLEKAPQKTA